MCCTYSGGDTSCVRGGSSYRSATPMGYSSGKALQNRPAARGKVGSSYRLGYPYTSVSANRRDSSSGSPPCPCASSMPAVGASMSRNAANVPSSSTTWSTSTSRRCSPSKLNAAPTCRSSHSHKLRTVSAPPPAAVTSSTMRAKRSTAVSSSMTLSPSGASSASTGTSRHHLPTTRPSCIELTSSQRSKMRSSTLPSSAGRSSSAPSSSSPKNRTSKPAAASCSAVRRSSGCPPACGANSRLMSSSLNMSNRRGS